MEKKSEGDMFSKKRYFVLYSDRLEYYKSIEAFKSRQPVQGVIDFSLLGCTIEVKSDVDMVISMMGCTKKFLLRQINSQNGFHQKISNAIRASRGLRDNMSLFNYYHKSQVPNFAKFWSQMRCLELDFISEAQTGDLLMVQRAKKPDKKVDEVFMVVEMPL